VYKCHKLLGSGYRTALEDCYEGIWNRLAGMQDVMVQKGQMYAECQQQDAS